MITVAQALAAADAEREEIERRAQLKKPKSRSQEFYASFAWRRLRYAVLAANAEGNGGVATCELCGTVAAAGSPLNVDHIEPLSKAWDRRLDKTNLQVLCAACNHGKLNYAARDWRNAPLGQNGHEAT